MDMTERHLRARLTAVRERARWIIDHHVAKTLTDEEFAHELGYLRRMVESLHLEACDHANHKERNP